jgi:hypothetical protein
LAAPTRTESTFGDRAYAFYSRLRAPKVPAGVEVMNPYRSVRVRGYVRQFLDKFYPDNRQRSLIIGINPGRFGAGVTGITFTDPVAMTDFCGIPNHLPRRRELSSVFIFDVIHHLGGPEKFFSKFFLSAVCPLGFTKGGVNMNYYDDPQLARAVTPFIVETLRKQIALGCRTDAVVVLGAGTNLKFVQRLNEEHRFFGQVHGLDHPRFIMQYRRKRLDEYLRTYEQLLAGL